jgi:hypothetical protein
LFDWTYLLKKHVDFSNLNKLSLEEAERLIRAHLIDGEFFYPQKVGIPLFPFHCHCDNDPWYEMESLEEVDCADAKQSIDEFIFNLKT